MPHPDHYPVLETERCILRMPEESDLHPIFKLRTDKDVNKYIDRPMPEHPDQALDFIKMIREGILAGKWFYWIISLKKNADLTGIICLYNFSEDKKTAETGYELLPEFQGKGIMKEAILTVIDFALKKTGVENIHAYSHKDNLQSKSLLRKTGFNEESEKTNPEDPDLIAYTLSKDNWNK